MSKPLPHSTPEANGLPSSAIIAFLDAAKANDWGLHSLMIVRHGAVIAEGWWSPYAPEKRHYLYSLSKSFTATAAGFAIAEGLFTLDDAVVGFFPDDLPAAVSENLAKLTVRHLLTMSTGHTVEPSLYAAPGGNWAKQFLATPIDHEPGLPFLYNTPATHMVGAIVQKLTRQDLISYLRPRLFDAIGIEDAISDRNPQGLSVGGSGMSMKTEDIARFGLLYLQKGMWEEKQVLPEGWAALATSKQVSNGDDANNDWNQGYGFQFWRCRHGAYRGDGAFGQFCLVMPEQDAVVAITSGSEDMGAILQGAWTHLLPAFTSPLPEDTLAHTTLSERLANLTIAAPVGEFASPLAATVTGKTYSFPENEQTIEKVSLAFADNACTLSVTDTWGEHKIVCGIGHWESGTTTLFQRRMWPLVVPQVGWSVAAQGAWESADTFTLKLCFDETPFIPTVTLRFSDNRVFFDVRGSIGFMPSEHPTLVGKGF